MILPTITRENSYPSSIGEEHQSKLSESDAAGERFMSLTHEVSSIQSRSLVDGLSKEIHSTLTRIYKPTKRQKVAVAAVIADLLWVASYEGEVFGYRPRGRDDFAGHRIAYSPCINCLDALVALGYLHDRPGVWLGTRRTGEGNTSAYRATAALLERCLAHGITPSNWQSHFALAPRSETVPHPIIVRAKRQYWDDERKGKKLPVIKSHPAYIAPAEQVQRINGYMAKQDITGCKLDGFVRIFNHGDDPAFAYNMGGRLYAFASGCSYQNMAKAYRAGFRINGEPVVEVDLRASFLTIMYGLRGISLVDAPDPYIISGLPRDVVKAWIAMTLGHDRFHRDWSAESVEAALEDGIDLAADYPIAAVRAKVLDEHPILTTWPSSAIRWQHLQNIEATAIINAVEALAFEHDVPALPLHDALLIPRSKIAIAREVLRGTFRKAVGVEPLIVAKERWGARGS